MDINYYKQFEPIDGKWYITKALGSGAFGNVFEVERKDYGTTKSAMKIISIPYSQSEVESYRQENYDLDENSITSYFHGFVEEFVKEFQLMSKLRGHSNIVTYEDHDVVKREQGIGWDIFIRMELLTPMNKFFADNNTNQNDVIKLGIDICKALEVCQKHKIVHRDIKPSNIFMSETGDFKLGDFGVAKTLEKTTGALSKKGTYTYMAPEVYKGEEYSPNVDIYSLGIVMYKLLNNNLEPFRTNRTYGDGENALAVRLNGETPIPKPAVADEKLAEIVLKACSYNPQERYQTPFEMRSELEKLLKSYEIVKDNPIQPKQATAEKNVNDVEIIDYASFEAEKTAGIFGDNNSVLSVEVSNETLKLTDEKEVEEDKQSLTIEDNTDSQQQDDKIFYSDSNKNKKRNIIVSVFVSMIIFQIGSFVAILPSKERQVSYENVYDGSYSYSIDNYEDAMNRYKSIYNNNYGYSIDTSTQIPKYDTTIPPEYIDDSNNMSPDKNEDEEYVPGVYNENGYYSEFWNIKLDVADGWGFYSKNDIDKIFNQNASQNSEIEIKTEAFGVLTDNSNAAVLRVAVVDSGHSDIWIEEYEKFIESDSVLTNIIKSKTYIAGEMYTYYTGEHMLKDKTKFQRYTYLREKNDCLLMIYVDCSSENHEKYIERVLSTIVKYQ